MNILLEMHHKPKSFKPREYKIRAIERVSPEEFFDIMQDPLQERPCIEKHIKDMGYDICAGEYGVLVIFDGITDDAIFIHSSGFKYCRNAAFVPGAMSSIREAVRDDVYGMIDEEIGVRVYSDEDETTHKLFDSWDEISKGLGFAVTEENFLRSTVRDVFEDHHDIKMFNDNKNGIEYEVFRDDDFITDEQDKQKGDDQS